MNDPHYLMWAALAAGLVGLSKGGLPTVGMLSVPILSLFMSPVRAVVMLLPIYIISDMVGLWLYRKNFSAINLSILIPAGVAGVVIGWLTTSVVSDVAVKLLIGLVGIGFCVNTWLKRKSEQTARPANVKKGLFWGTVAGFTSFISHAGAPPFQVYMLPQKLPKAEFGGTATIVFAVINEAKILPYQNLRPYAAETLWSAATLIPFALVGAVGGAYLTRRIAEVWFYRIVQISLFGVSLKLVADAATGGH